MLMFSHRTTTTTTTFSFPPCSLIPTSFPSLVSVGDGGTMMGDHRTVRSVEWTASRPTP